MEVNFKNIFMDDFKRIEFEEFKERLVAENIKEYDGKTDVYDYRKLARKKIINAVGEFPQFIINPNINSSQLSPKVYRGRLSKDVKNIFLRSEFSYPPMKVCENKRANLARNPVFYGSPNLSACLFETIQNYNLMTDTSICLSVWSIDPKKKFSVAPYIIGTIDKSHELYSLSQKIISNIPIKLKENFSSDEIEFKKDLIIFFSNLFVNNNLPSISSIIAFEHLFVANKINTDIFIYPSLQLKQKEINYAINPNFVDESMHLERVYEVTLKNIVFNNGNPKYKMAIKKLAIVEGSRIIWRVFNEFKESEIDMINSDFKGFIKDGIQYTPRN